MYVFLMNIYVKGCLIIRNRSEGSICCGILTLFIGELMKKAIACFGDSLMYGFPFGKEQSWLTKVNEMNNNIIMLNYGECGASCDDIFANMKNTVLAKEVKHIMFLGGANDIIQNRPQNFTLMDINKAARWALEQHYNFGLVLLWFTAEPALNEKIGNLRAKICEQFNNSCQLFDLQPAIGFTASELTAAYLDGVHPTLGTYTRLAEYAEPLIEVWLNGGQT